MFGEIYIFIPQILKSLLIHSFSSPYQTTAYFRCLVVEFLASVLKDSTAYLTRCQVISVSGNPTEYCTYIHQHIYQYLRRKGERISLWLDSAAESSLIVVLLWMVGTGGRVGGPTPGGRDLTAMGTWFCPASCCFPPFFWPTGIGTNGTFTFKETLPWLEIARPRGHTGSSLLKEKNAKTNKSTNSIWLTD